MSDHPGDDYLLLRNTDNRDWARNVLSVPADATPAQKAAVLLTRLEETEFVPPPQWEQAMLLLTAKPPRELCKRYHWEALLRSRELTLKTEIDRLASEFFSLPVAERHTRWRVLMEKCEFSIPLRARLEGLVDGLDVTFPLVQGNLPLPVFQLAQEIGRAFVLPPSERIACHEEILRRAESDPKAWQGTAQQFRKSCPQIVSLAATLIDTLADYVRLRKMANKLEARKRAALARAAKQSAGGRSWSVWLLPLIIVAVNAGRLFTPSSSPSEKIAVPRAAPPTSNSSMNFIDDLQKALKRGILPPRDPRMFPEQSKDEGKVEVGEAGRRLFGIPDDVEVYRENGELVLRRVPGVAPSQTPAIPNRTEPVTPPK